MHTYTNAYIPYRFLRQFYIGIHIHIYYFLVDLLNKLIAFSHKISSAILTRNNIFSIFYMK